MRRILLALLLAAPVARAAVPTVRITGNQLLPDGSAPAGGTITCSLSQPGSVPDGVIGSSQRVAAEATFTLANGGALPSTAALVPNDAITPGPNLTTYACAFRLQLLNGRQATPWTERWSISSSPSTISIGAITRVAQPGTAVFVAGPKGDSGVVPPVTTSDYFDPAAAVAAMRVTSGTYSGGYLVAPNGYLNVYFAALGLRSFVTDQPAQVQAFLDLVLDNLVKVNDGSRGQYTIYDVDGMQTTPVLRDPDSNDSYAAVVNLLAYEYAKTNGSWAWYSGRAALLKNIAYYNIATARKTTANAPGFGMARTFQTSAWGSYYNVCLTEDNAEVYAGLDALSKGLAQIGDTDSSYYAATRDGVAAGMHNATWGTWDDTNRQWLISDARAPLGTAFYPDAVTQIFAETYGVPSGNAATDRQRYDWAWSKLNALAPGWYQHASNDFPWLQLGYVAALRGASDMAVGQLALARNAFTAAKRSIHECGWYRGIERILAARDVSIAGARSAVALNGTTSTPLVATPAAANDPNAYGMSVTTSTASVGGSTAGGTDRALSAWNAFAFAPSSSTTGGVSIRLKKGASVADGGSVSAYIYSDNAGVPGSDISMINTGLPSTTGLPTIIGTSEIGASYANLPFRIPKVGLTVNGIYWIVLKTSGISGGSLYIDSAAAGGNFAASAPDSGGAPGAWTTSAFTGSMSVSGSTGRGVYSYSPDGHSVEAFSDTGIPIYGRVQYGGIAVKGDAVGSGIGVGGTSYNGIGSRGSSNLGLAGQFISLGNYGAQIQGTGGAQLVATSAGAPAMQGVNTAGGNLWQGLDSTASYANTSQIDSHGNTYLAGSWLGAATTLGTCGTTDPVHTLRFVTGSGSTPSKICYCSFTPTGSVYAWVSLTKNSAGTGIGTTTTCP
jgi:hypothetical protein